MSIGILATLFARTRTGRGQRVDASLIGGQIWAQAGELSYQLIGGVTLGRANRGHAALPLVYRVFRTSDGYMVIAGVTDNEWSGFVHAAHPASNWNTTHASLLRFFVRVISKNCSWFSSRCSKHVRLRIGANVCERKEQRFGSVNTYAEVAAYEQLYINGYLREVNHPQWGPIKAVGNPITLSDTPALPADWASELGQHTEEVLLAAGYTWEDIERLREQEVI